jgi:hypothetical protein
MRCIDNRLNPIDLVGQKAEDDLLVSVIKKSAQLKEAT